MSVLPVTGFDALPADVAGQGRPARSTRVQRADVRADPAWLRWTIISVSTVFLGIFIVLPLVTVFSQAFSKGVAAYFAALADPDSCRQSG